MTKSVSSYRAGNKITCGKKVLSVLLTVMMLIMCFGPSALAANNTNDAAISDVKIIRPFNSDYSMVKVYDKGLWEARALADENGNTIYYESNPIHAGGIYRGMERNIYTENSKNWKADITGSGKTKDNTFTGEEFDAGFPLSWQYDQLHIALKYENLYEDDGVTPIDPNSDFAKNMFSLNDCIDVIYMDHHLVVPDEFLSGYYILYTIEEVYENKIELNEGEIISVYFEPDTNTEYSDLQLTFANTDIAEYKDGKIYGNKAGNTTATLTLKNTDGSIFTKSFDVTIDHVDKNTSQPSPNVSFLAKISEFFAKIINFFKNIFKF